MFCSEPDLVSNYLQRFSAHLAVNELSVAVIGEQKHHIICFYNTGIDFVVFVVCFFFQNQYLKILSECKGYSR